MKRLTQRSNFGTAYYPRCFEEPCIGDGCKIKDCLFDNTICERLAAYEDTGLMPGDIKGLIELSVAKTNKALRLEEELRAMKNELCQYCGKYKHAHEGACDGCLWREK